MRILMALLIAIALLEYGVVVFIATSKLPNCQRLEYNGKLSGENVIFICGDKS